MSHAHEIATPLANGTLLPEIDLLNEEGQSTSLTSFIGEKGIVVGFIHGTWCPYCLDQLVRLNLIAPELNALGVGLICVTHDDQAAIHAYGSGLHLPLRYKLLPDKDPSIAHLFGIYDPGHDSPFPAVFYAGADRIIRYSDVSSDPDCHPDTDRLLSAIQSAG